MHGYRQAVLLLLALAGCAACGGAGSGGDRGVDRVARPTTAEELELQLDDAGRPLAGSSSWVVHGQEFDPLGTFSIPGGELLLMDGISLWVGSDGGGTVPVRLPAEEVELSVLRVLDGDGGSFVSNAFVMLEVPEAGPVRRWGDLEYAYGTDGGMGGFTGPAVMDEIERRPVDADDFLYLDIDLDLDHHLFDLDGRPGNDTFLFGNGYGDGGFPYALGYDADDEVAALVIWNLSYPWGTVFHDSAPPPAVTRREDDLLACMNGTRPVEVSSPGFIHCPSDDW